MIKEFRNRGLNRSTLNRLTNKMMQKELQIVYSHLNEYARHEAR